MNNLLAFPLDQVDPNPYQPREKEDPEHIAKIAASILQEGLLQPPVGRLRTIMGRPADEAMLQGRNIEQLDVLDWRVQLAFGHTRLAALRLIDLVMSCLMQSKAVPFEFEVDSPKDLVVTLAESRLDRRAEFDHLPVIIRFYSDEEMFREGLAENLARKDLTAFEEAKAMLRYRDQFSKTSREIGALFGKNESTVRGKIALLDLPADLQSRLASVPEVALREILAMLRLPQDLLDRAENYYDDLIHPSAIIAAAERGDGAEQIGRRVTRIIQAWGKDLSGAPWKHDRADWPHMENIVGDCKSCAYRVLREKRTWCLKSVCGEAKQRIVKQEDLQEASAASGIPAYDGDQPSYYLSDFSYKQTQFDIARKANCENLVLIWEESESKGFDRVEGFPHARIVCKRRNGQCTCKKAMENNMAQVVEKIGEKAQAAGVDGPQAVITTDDLKEINREERRAKRKAVVDVQKLRELAAEQIAAALEGDNPAIWYYILLRYDWGLAKKHQEKDWDADWQSHAEKMRAEIAMNITQQIYDTSYSDPVTAMALSLFNKFLKSAHLEPVALPAEEKDKGFQPV